MRELQQSIVVQEHPKWLVFVLHLLVVSLLKAELKRSMSPETRLTGTMRKVEDVDNAQAEGEQTLQSHYLFAVNFTDLCVPLSTFCVCKCGMAMEQYRNDQLNN